MTTHMHFCRRRGLFCGLIIGLITYVHTQTVEQCTAYRHECEKDLRALGTTNNSRLSCQACHTTCASLKKERGTSTNKTIAERPSHHAWKCLSGCAKVDCLGNEIEDARVTQYFRCRVNHRRCNDHYKFEIWNATITRELCGNCATTCGNANNHYARVCERRCWDRNTTCAAGSDANKNPPPPTFAVPPKTKVKTKPRPNAARDPTPKPVKDARAEVEPTKLWEWLGPVLGSIATIIGAVITVIWVRDYRHQNPRPDQPSFVGGTANGEYDEASQNQNDQVGISYGADLSPHRSSRFAWTFKTSASVFSDTTKDSDT